MLLCILGDALRELEDCCNKRPNGTVQGEREDGGRRKKTRLTGRTCYGWTFLRGSLGSDVLLGENREVLPGGSTGRAERYQVDCSEFDP